MAASASLKDKLNEFRDEVGKGAKEYTDHKKLAPSSNAPTYDWGRVLNMLADILAELAGVVDDDEEAPHKKAHKASH